MSAAYSAMVRSLENFPEPATFKIALRAQASGSAYSSHSRRSASEIGREVRQVHVVVATRQQRVPQRCEDARFIPAEVVGEDQVQRRAGLRLRCRNASAGCTSPGSRPPGPPSGRTGRSSPRPLPPPFRWSRRRVCRSVSAPFIMNFMLLVPLAS